MSDSVWPHRWQPTRLPRPWDSPGKNTGVGCHFLLQCMKVKRESEVAQSCPSLSDRMVCSLPGSSIHGIFQARVLAWGATAFSDLHVYLYIKYVPGSDESKPGQKCHRLLLLLPRVQQLSSIKAYQSTMYLWAISRFLKWLLCQFRGRFLFFVLFRERICQVPQTTILEVPTPLFHSFTRNRLNHKWY